MECGEPCVMIPGQQLMQLRHANILDIQPMVRQFITGSCTELTVGNFSLLQQRLWPMAVRTLGQHSSLSSLMMWHALDQNLVWWSAPMTAILLTAHIPKMLVPAAIPVRFHFNHLQYCLTIKRVRKRIS